MNYCLLRHNVVNLRVLLWFRGFIR